MPEQNDQSNGVCVKVCVATCVALMGSPVYASLFKGDGFTVIWSQLREKSA